LAGEKKTKLFAHEAILAARGPVFATEFAEEQPKEEEQQPKMKRIKRKAKKSDRRTARSIGSFSFNARTTSKQRRLQRHNGVGKGCCGSLSDQIGRLETFDCGTISSLHP
jgi:hypothetical protein